MQNDSIGRQSTAQSYWENNPTAAYSNQWTSNPVIADKVYQRISGGQTTKHWLNWLLEDYFNGRKFESFLSPGCGTGLHEIIVSQSKITKTLDAFDFSFQSLELAKNSALQAGVKINFYQDDLNTFTLPESKKYDVVMCAGSLHHVKELERFLSVVVRHLQPDGYFIINEYVGECYNIYSKKQLQLINRLYRCVSSSLRSSSIEEYTNHTIEQSFATDPSECVRSKLILPFVENYFDIELYRPFGGGLLHTLYPLLDHNQFSDTQDAKSVSILKLLLEFEEILMELSGGLATDFCLCILRPKC